MAEKEIDLRSEVFDGIVAKVIGAALDEGLDPRQAVAVLLANVASLAQFTIAHGKWTHQQAAGIYSQSMLNALKAQPAEEEGPRIQIAGADELPSRKN